MWTVCGQQYSFLKHKRTFFWKCQSFWDRKCLDLRRTRTPNLQIHENALTIWATGVDICCPMVLNTGYGGVDIFEVQLAFEMLTLLLV